VSEKIRAAIWSHLVCDTPKGRQFVWASDLKENKQLGREPAGCLQLLPYWGFCEASEPAWRNTAASLHGAEGSWGFGGAPFAELACPSAPHPWPLAVASSLLSGRRDEAREWLKKAPMDSRLACQTVNEKTGACASGPAWASAAGFLAWALWKACGRVNA
jgi:hypothetical protein